MATITESTLKQKLTEQLQASHVVIKDISGGCGQSFDVLVVSEIFVGKPLLQRHRLVNECLEEEMTQIHAITIKTHTPEQWTKINDTS